jgi:hypothetical protein
LERHDIVIGMVTTWKIQALAWWVSDKIRRGTWQSTDLGEWTADLCRESIKKMDLEKEEGNVETSKLLHPGKNLRGKG